MFCWEPPSASVSSPTEASSRSAELIDDAQPGGLGQGTKAVRDQFRSFLAE